MNSSFRVRCLSTWSRPLLTRSGSGNDPRTWKNEGDPLRDPGGVLGDNDRVATHVRNRNPMNLERMRIAPKPCGFPLERTDRGYWNRLDLSLSQQHTTARVVHWTGRIVCSASTREWAVRRFLYNNTDAAAVEAVGRVVGQRAIETGVIEVYLKVIYYKKNVRPFCRSKDSLLLRVKHQKNISFLS